MYVRMRISHGGVSEELDTSLECAESIYVKTTCESEELDTSLECAESIYLKTTCESEELEDEEEDGQIVSLGDSRMQRVAI